MDGFTPKDTEQAIGLNGLKSCSNYQLSVVIDRLFQLWTKAERHRFICLGISTGVKKKNYVNGWV